MPKEIKMHWKTTIISLFFLFSPWMVSATEPYMFNLSTPDSMVFEDYTGYFQTPPGGIGSRVMILQVDFPDIEPNPGSIITANWDSVETSFENYFTNQSGGMVNLDLIDLANPFHVYGRWVADYPIETYLSIEGLASIEPDGSRYLEHKAPGSAIQTIFELYAEILHKVYNTYWDNFEQNPFENVSMVLICPHGSIPGIGGEGLLSVAVSTFDFLDVMDDVFFEQAKGRVPGFMQVTGTGENASVGDYCWVLTHEAGHFFGLGHLGLGSCGYNLSYNLDFYGAYTPMPINICAGMGPLPLSPPELAQLGWVEVEEVSSTQRRIVLEDIRHEREVLKVTIPNSIVEIPGIPEGIPLSALPQSFYLSYHGGHGMESNLGENGMPIYSAKGLAVWHVMPGVYEDLVFLHRLDIESAWGRFDDPDFTLPGEGSWSVPNATSGFDNLDTWTRLCGLDHTAINYDFYYDFFRNYTGSEKDFFGTLSNVREFSYRSNPNTFGESVWSNPQGEDEVLPQDIPNSIIIRVVEEYESSVVLDILFAPEEEIQSPNGGEIFSVGEPIEITWSKEYTIDQPDGIIDLVDLYYSPGLGLPDEIVALGVDATVESYTWSPGASHVSTTGKIKIVYHNVNDATHVGTDESDDFFEIIPAPEAKFTNVSTQTGLSYAGTPYGGVSLNFDSDLQKDLLVTIIDENVEPRVFVQLQVLPSGAPLFIAGVDLGQFGGLGASAADYDNDGDQDLFVADATTPKLYRNDGGTYVDVTAAVGLAALADESTAACWGDYDRDGWVDLYVVRTTGYVNPPAFPAIFWKQHRLFRNDVGGGGGFVDVTTSSGLDGEAAMASMSASWVDVNNDDYLDIFVADYEDVPAGSSGIHSRLFVNQGDGTFVEDLYSCFSDAMLFSSAQKWADVDNDLDLDLVVSSHFGGVRVRLNDGFGVFPPGDVISLDVPGEISDVQVFDHDLDGWKDILAVSNDPAHSSRFFSGVMQTSGLKYVQNTSNVNLSGIGEALGAVTTDFTRDGDSDLYLGRPISSGECFFKTDSKAGSNTLGKNYVKIRLNSEWGINNRQGIGAVVVITAGSDSQMLVVDGGSGRGGQTDRDLVFGLGSYAGPVTATIKWPGGYLQSGVPVVISNDTAGETLNTIDDGARRDIKNALATSVIDPSTGELDWTFSWETDIYCDPALDSLELTGGHRINCWDGWSTVTANTPGVTHSIEPRPDGGFTHKFIVNDQDCIINCSFEFVVTSGIGTKFRSSASQLVTVGFCPSQF